jgi:hypothetical protein
LSTSANDYTIAEHIEVLVDQLQTVKRRANVLSRRLDNNRILLASSTDAGVL